MFFLDTTPAIEAYLQCTFGEVCKYAYNVENDTLKKEKNIERTGKFVSISFL